MLTIITIPIIILIKIIWLLVWLCACARFDLLLYMLVSPMVSVYMVVANQWVLHAMTIVESRDLRRGVA